MDKIKNAIRNPKNICCVRYYRVVHGSFVPKDASKHLRTAQRIFLTSGSVHPQLSLRLKESVEKGEIA